MYGWWMCELVLKLRERGANIVDAIENRDLQIVFGVPVGRQGMVDDELPLLPHQIGPATHLHS